MKGLGNFIWVICMGWWLAASWCVAGALAYLTIIGIPWGKACFVMAKLAFLPFGRTSIKESELTGKESAVSGTLRLIGNIVWFIFAGFWIALGHLSMAITSGVTIIGIPFAIQHLKLAAIAISPVGKTVVDIALVEEIERLTAKEKLSEIRGCATAK